MADQQIGSPYGVTAVSVGNGTTNRSNINGSTSTPDVGYIDTDLNSISACRTRLAAINGTYYTATRLNNMTHNDMIYAIRQNDDPTTIR